MRKTSAQPISAEASAQLQKLRAQGETFETLAAKVPCSSATLWKAHGGGALARGTRWMLELRLRELSAGVPQEGATL